MKVADCHLQMLEAWGLQHDSDWAERAEAALMGDAAARARCEAEIRRRWRRIERRREERSQEGGCRG